MKVYGHVGSPRKQTKICYGFVILNKLKQLCLHEQVKYASVSISDMLKIPNLAFTRREREYVAHRFS